MGRIPVFIAPNSKLPLENCLDWNNHCVFTTRENIETAILEFYDSKSELELQNIQFSNRKLALELFN